MIITASELISQLEKDYSNPKCKLGRLVKEGKYTQIIRGLYETDPDAEGYLLAESVYGPSYLSFEYALYRHGMMIWDERTFTSATCGKHRTKRHETSFGTFVYRDVPAKVFGLEVDMENVGDYKYSIARPEKALCDYLYSLPPASDADDLRSMLFSRMGLDEYRVMALDADMVSQLSDGYRCKNIYLMCRLLSR